MPRYSLQHVENDVLLRDLSALVAQDRATTAMLLAHLAEVKERKLYRGAAQPNMHYYCVNVLRFSEDAAHKRLQAAGAARRFPVIFDALADGRLHLSGVCLLAPHLLPENADELILAAFGKTKAGIEKVLADKFPQPDVPEMVQPIGVPASATSVLPGPGPKTAPGQFFESSSQALTGSEASGSRAATSAEDAPQVHSSRAEGQVAAPEYPRVKPLSPQRYALQVTLDEQTHDLLREAQDLLAATEGGRQISNVLRHALDHFVRHLRQRRFAETARPQRSTRKPKSVRTIPAEMKRAVRTRDEGRCTFMSEKGERCPARSGLEHDHIVPVAKGGDTTVENLRLRCRAHNQLAAEQAYGAEFMQAKRVAAQSTSKAKKKTQVTRDMPRIEPAARAAIHEKAFEAVPWLRQHSAPAP